ncbi:MAG: hypothetical protein ACTSPI_01285 [Candidatus Heimdallarchaeaceae archaeon]
MEETNTTAEQEKEVLHTLLKTKENTSFVISENPKANSYEFGKAGNRFKLYFSDTAELQHQLTGLMGAELITEEDFGCQAKQS